MDALLRALAAPHATCRRREPLTSEAEAARYSNFSAVKSAFEDVYACLGITCAQVGGLLNGAAPYPGAEACS